MALRPLAGAVAGAGDAATSATGATWTIGDRGNLADGSLSGERWQAYLRMQRASAYEVRRTSLSAQQRTKTDHKKATKALRGRVREKSGEE